MDNSVVATIRDCRLDILEALNTNYSLALAICYRYNEWSELYRLLGNNDTLADTSWVFPDRKISKERAFLQAKALFSKSDDLPEIPLLEEDALKSFFDCEAKNKETNNRILFGEISSPLVYRTNVILTQILGEFSELEWAQYFRFGPGVSSTCRGLHSTILHKLESKIECTPEALPMVRRGFKHFFQYYHHDAEYTVASSNVFLTVEKSYKERRGICISRHGNIPAQLALGLCLKERLKPFINIDYQADYHKKLVRQHWREIATIDLRKASQMIARRLPELVFPPDWFDAMDTLRESSTILPNGKVQYNEHFSAMGNGFTFEMETLLFYATAKAALQNAGVKWKFLSVFGDDIIVDKEHAQIVSDALVNFGFEINSDKTFIDGPFKESCGVDTLYGRNVRPVFIRHLKGRKTDEILFKLANSAIRMAANSGHGLCFDARFYRAWMRVVRKIPSHRRFFSTNANLGRSPGWKIPDDNSVLYCTATRELPEGSVNKFKLVEKRRTCQPGDSSLKGRDEAVLGAALLGYTYSSFVKSRKYSLVRRRSHSLSRPCSMIWI